MTANFNFPRLVKLILKQWIENARIYMFSTLAIIGILGLVFIFWIAMAGNDYQEETLYIIFTFGIYTAGSVFASMSFGMLTEKRRGIYWLGFPASHLEKLLTVIFFNLIVFTIIYSLCFFLIKTLAVAYVHKLVATDSYKYSYQLAYSKNSGSFMEVFPNFIYGFFAAQAFYMLGSVYFSRFSFVMTTVTGVALIFIFMWFNVSLFKHELPTGFFWNGLDVTKYYNKKGGGLSDYHTYQLPFILLIPISFLVKFIWAPVFWLITWFRLKEKEI